MTILPIIPNPPEILIVDLIVNSNTSRRIYHEHLRVDYNAGTLSYKLIKSDRSDMKTLLDNTQHYNLKSEDIAEMLFPLWIFMIVNRWIIEENSLNPHKNSSFSINVNYRDGKIVRHSGRYDRSGINVLVKEHYGEDLQTFLWYTHKHISLTDKSFMFDIDEFYNALRLGEYKYCVIEPDSLNESNHWCCRLDDLTKNVGDKVVLTDSEGKRFSGTIESIGFFREGKKRSGFFRRIFNFWRRFCRRRCY